MLRRSFFVSLWFSFLTFPIMVIRVNTIEKTVNWRFGNLLLVAVGSFILSLLWQYLFARREKMTKNNSAKYRAILSRFFSGKIRFVVGFAVLLFPFLLSTYHINVLTTALIYVVLGLGLNIIVGLTGLLNLGYVAFYAVGAYLYALLNHHFGFTFWICLPLGGLVSACFGLLLALPVMRLRGDYLAIVTLGFGEMTRLVLENWSDLTYGPSGISGIAPPTFLGITFGIRGTMIYLYFLMVAFCLLAIFLVRRLRDSRIGRAWVAIREDEEASRAMGINTSKAKSIAMMIGAAWAGMMGVVFAAKTTFVNPASFSFLESAMVLSIVVLGGIGSIGGIIIAAFAVILLPEYLRFLSDYRMLAFGCAMVVMMIFRPQGILPYHRRTYEFKEVHR